MGVGKTTLSRLLQEKIPRTALISYDQVKWFLADFNADETDFELTFRVEKAIIREYLASGINVILDKAFTDSKLIDEIKMLADELSAETLTYQLETPLEIAQDRVIKRPPSRKRAEPPSPEKVARSFERYHENKHLDAKIIDTSKLLPEEIVQQIILDIKKG
jgi:predicted kinase